MLHKDPFVIDPFTFELTQKLQALPELKDFYLVGGTALALQLGHRNSIDIDLFTNTLYDKDLIISTLTFAGFKFVPEYIFKNSIIGFVNEVKVDFIFHPYPLIKEPITEEGITFLSLEDITAMKLNAITNSGKRLKDFIDVYYLLEHFSIHQMLEFYTTKYKDFNPLIALKSINYFDDIDPDIDPPKLKIKLPLEKIKKRINDAVLHSSTIFR